MRRDRARGHGSAVLAALAAASAALVACTEAHQAPTETPLAPAAYTTFPLDTLTGNNLDTGGWWGGVTLLVAPDQSLHFVAMDMFNVRLRYHGCAAACGDSSHWVAGTADSLPVPWGNGPSGAVMTPAGIVAMYTFSGQSGGIRYADCPGDCQFARNWEAATLFTNQVTSNGANGVHYRTLAADSSGGLHLLFMGTPDHLWHYAYCAAGCANQASWLDVGLDSTAAALSGQAVTIAVAPDGRVHLLYGTGQGLVHATCAANCTAPASWRYEIVPGAFLLLGISSIATAFGPDGRLHVAYADLGRSVTYATCGAPCAAPGEWSATVLPVTALDVSLVVDGGGETYLASSDRDVEVSRCASGCLGSAGWSTATVDSALGDGEIALAVDSTGRVSVASSYGNWPMILQFSRQRGQ